MSLEYKHYASLITRHASHITVLCAFAVQILLLSGCNLHVSEDITLTQTQVSVEQVELAARPTSALLPTPTQSSPTLGIFSPEVVAHLQAVYAAGQARGNHPQVFAKVGDSITVSTHFLTPLGDGVYNLGEYAYLQPVVDYFRLDGLRDNSFNRRSLAAGEGWGAWAVLSTSYRDRTACTVDEVPLVCEYRLIQPSFALVMFGTNDAGYRLVEEYQRDLDRIVTLSEEHGVIAILSTVPPRPGYENKVAALNAAVRAITAAHNLPVWDYGAAMEQLPNYGLTTDYVHPSSPPGGYDAAANFTGNNLNYGYVVRNLTALHILDAVWRTVQPPT